MAKKKRAREPIIPPVGTFAVATRGGVIRIQNSEVSGWQRAAHADTGGEVHFVNVSIDAPQIAAIRSILKDSQLTADEKAVFLRVAQSALCGGIDHRRSLLDWLFQNLKARYGLAILPLIDRVRSVLRVEEE